MKKVLSLFLAVVMMVSACFLFSSCENNNDEGAVINAYFVGEQFQFDPLYALVDDDAARVLSLLFEPLFRLDKGGRVQYALAEKYEIIRNKDKELYQMEITLRDASWSNGTRVTADDVVKAWQRIIDPNTKSQAAPLLYDIAGALEVKNGELTSVEGDFRVTAESSKLLSITFCNRYDENGKLVEIDYDAFLRKLTSLALAPVPSSMVATAEDYWGRMAATLLTNGPFRVSTMDNLNVKQFTIERNRYYHRLKSDNEANITNKALKESVRPYQIVTSWSEDSFETLAQRLEENTVFLLCDMPLEMRKEYKKQATATDILSTSTVLFNLNEGNALLSSLGTERYKNLRLALSAAIDREEIAELLTFAKPATGFLSGGVLEGKKRNSTFRNAKDASLLSVKTDSEKAQTYLAAANLTSSVTIRLAVSSAEADYAVGEYLKTTWEALSPKIKVRLTKYTHLTKEIRPDENDPETVYIVNIPGAEDIYYNAESFKKYDAVLMDYQMLSPDAFAPLCGFASAASGMSGNGYNVIPDADGYQHLDEKYGHMTGYANAAYDELIKNAYAEPDPDKRAPVLHQAEETLLSDMPLIPLTFGQSFYVKSRLLSDIGNDNYYGYPVFTKLKMKNYTKYLPQEETTTETH